MTLVVGVGTSSGVAAGEVADLVQAVLASAGLTRSAVVAVATIAAKAHEPAIVTLGWPVAAFTADQLKTVVVPTPSAVARAAVGTPSVAEAAALLAAGPGGHLVVPKQASAHATVAVARSGPR